MAQAEDTNKTMTNTSYSSTEGRMATVADLKNMDDNTMIRLTGNIERQVDGDHYSLRDNTGTVELKMSDDVMRTMPVANNQRVEVYGELDKGIISQTKVEVKRIVNVN